MAKPLKPRPLSSMTGGLNRYEREAKPDQAVEASNVVNDDGDLRRRDAFAAFAMSAPFMLPAGQVYVKSYDYNAQAWTNYSGRLVTGAFSSFGTNTAGAERLFIGCDTQFQGFEWAHFVRTGTFSSGIGHIRIRFVTSNWSNSADPASDTGLYSTCIWVGDSTLSNPRTGTSTDHSDLSFYQSLTRTGHIFWHKNSQPSAWDTETTVDSQSAYWIIVDMYNAPQNSDEAASLTDYSSTWPSGWTSAMIAPGIRCFQLNPVTALFDTGLRSNAMFLMGSSSTNRRGQESGGPQLGYIEGVNMPTCQLGLIKDSGAGVLGTYVNAALSGGSSGPGAGKLSKNDTSYSWQLGTANLAHRGSWGPPIIRTSVSPTGTPSSTSFTFTQTTGYNNEYEDCLFLCTDPGASDVVQYKQNRVKTSTISGTTVTVTFAAAWEDSGGSAAAPTTDSVFSIFGIPHRVILAPSFSAGGYDGTTIAETRQFLEANTTDTSDGDVLDVNPLGPNGDASVFIGDRRNPSAFWGINKLVFFDIEKEARYELPENPFPDYTFDETTRRFVFAFGAYPLQTWDGARLRTLKALYDPADLVVEAWTGFVNERFVGDIDDPGFIRNSFLRTEPPQGQFVQSFANRLFVAGIPGDPSRVAYSAPGSFNDVWPKGYEVLVRDHLSRPITGMNTLNDELVIFTNSSIYAAGAPNEDGYMSVFPRSQGIGFVNNNVVQRAAIGTADVLIGANADGIYAYTGAEPQIILDAWDRIIDGGVNRATMYRACATVSYYENCYYLAVPSLNNFHPDKLVRYCWTDKTFYVWSAPFGGITSMVTRRDSLGNEELVFGHADGTISRLEKNLTDDGETITGTARTAVFTAGGFTMAISGYMLTLDDTGASGSVTVYEYLNQDDAAPNTLYTGDFDAGTAEVDSFTVGTDSIGSRKKKTKRIHAKSGTRAESVQLEISGSTRWRLRNIELLMNPLGQRST